jgi:hypothetical protein
MDMDTKPDELNPFTQKKRTRSNGTRLGDLTEAFHAAPSREEKYKLLKGNPELQPYFRLDDFADLDA